MTSPTWYPGSISLAYDVIVTLCTIHHRVKYQLLPLVAAFTIASRKWNPVYGAIVTPGTVLTMQPHPPRDVTVTSATWFPLVDHVANWCHCDVNRHYWPWE